MVFENEGNRLGFILAASDRCITRTLLLRLRHFHMRDGMLRHYHAVIFVLLRLRDFFGSKLTTRNWVLAHDAGRDFAIGDALDLERVHTTEIADLLERKCRIFN